MVEIDSDEFKAWHEVGHAVVCLHLGGDLDCIEFLEGSAQGFAVTRGCLVFPDMERSVACGGFAAEMYLLQVGFVEGVNLNDPSTIAEISSKVFSNAWSDRQAFVDRKVTEQNDFTLQENEQFLRYATNHVVPIISQYIGKMQIVVDELVTARRIDGTRVKEILNFRVIR